MIAEWIAHNEEIEHGLVVDHNFGPVSDFVLAWAYAEHCIINSLNGGRGSLGCPVFNTILTARHNLTSNNYVDQAYVFFSERYAGVEGGRLFDGLNFRNGEEQNHRSYCLEVIASNNVSDYNKIKCSAFICSRIRNNLFHGAKDMRMILEQGDLLRAATIGIMGLTISLDVASDIDE